MNNGHVLVVDDEPSIGILLREILEDEGLSVTVAENAEAARQQRREKRLDLILLDIWMPDTDGISLLKEWQENGLYNTPVIMMSGHGTVETAVEATRLGAYDFIEKPIVLSKLLLTVQRALEMVSLQKENTDLKHCGIELDEPIGHSSVISNLRSQAKRLMQHDTPVLITGESGSGRALFARYLHNHSQRSDNAFIPVRMAGMSSKEQAKTLFGDAEHNPSGLLEQAHGGTLFIKDIADMDKTVQARLLGRLEADELLKPDEQIAPVDVRVIAATAYDLEQVLSNGKLQEELYYYLNVVSFSVPPLREHCEDIPELLEYYITYFVSQENLSYRHFTVAAQNRLRHYHWPGNVRELKNLVQRLLILGTTDDIQVNEIDPILNSQQHISLNNHSSVYDLPLREAREQFERAYLEHQLKLAGGNVSKVAQQVGLERTHLYRKLRALDIDPKQSKQK